MIDGFAEFKRKLIFERTKSGRVSKGINNLFPGGRVPFGYRLIDNDSLEIDEKEDKVIKDIFELRSKGLSLSKIGEKYNFSKQRVHYILTNKTYMGRYIYNGKTERNHLKIEVQKIVTRYMFEKANSK